MCPTISISCHTPQINLPPKGTSWATKEGLGSTSKLPAVTDVSHAMMAGSGA